MFPNLPIITLLAGCLLAIPASAQTLSAQNGTDTFWAGKALVETLDAPGDVFLAGQSAVARGAIPGDLHIVGMDVSVSATTGEDLYALGATVALGGTVGKDVSATGMTVRTEPGADAGGNVRLVGGTVTVEGAVGGALSVSGQTVILNAPVSGDARIFAETLQFGPQARIDGLLSYTSETEVAVPPEVAPAERVRFERATGFDGWEHFDNMREMPEMPGLPGLASVLFGLVVSVLFFAALGALALGFMPRQVERLRAGAAQDPARALVVGVIGLSILFGLVPITALTIVGLLFVPIVVLAIVVAWTLGYALGAYCLAMRLWAGFGGDAAPGTMPRVMVFVAVIAAVALLNFIPFVGWVANYTLVLLGVGAMTQALYALLFAAARPKSDLPASDS